MARVSSNSFISVGLAAMIGGGIYTLAARITSWENRLDSFDEKLSDLWTYRMERESWIEVQLLNPGFKIPNASAIKNEHVANGMIDAPAQESVYIADDCFRNVN